MNLDREALLALVRWLAELDAAAWMEEQANELAAEDETLDASQDRSQICHPAR
jgi:hypothetical protein